MLASVALVLLPLGERLPPLILRATTCGRRALSAALLSEGTIGSSTKVNSSGKKRSVRW